MQKQDYKMALRKYRKALRYLDICWEKEEIDEGKQLNFFACKLKLGDLKGALLDADFALREREGNAKAYFRQGQVSMFFLKIYLLFAGHSGVFVVYLDGNEEEIAVETSTKFVECCSNQATIHGPAMRSGGPWHRTVSRQSRRRLSPTPIFSTPLRRMLAVALKIPKSMAVVTSTVPWATRFGALLAAPARLRISLSIGLPGKHRTLPSSLRRTMASASAATPPTSGVGEKVTAPYGSWKSPITADVVAGADKRLGGIAAGGDGRLVWIESRPEEGGYVGSFL
ncbi:hypothetical protein B296_00033802 [Ensete ventricosum]|uniref:Uncharacterized protein n=1 Tax=Ensete ventricosum TaxID=4639 RepID=A0A426YFP8_ENSVE|nr:hypothetical protein B296_00033802 [Ensete ventricosum]